MERVLANKANWLARQVDAQGQPEYDIFIATSDQKGRPSAFEMDPAIRMVDLDINYEENNGGSLLNKIVNFPIKQLRHRSRLKKVVKDIRPDIIISMFGNEAGFLPGLVKSINRRNGTLTRNARIACLDNSGQGKEEGGRTSVKPIKTILEIHFSRFKRIQYARTGMWSLVDRFRSRQDIKTAKAFDRFVVLTEEDKEYWLRDMGSERSSIPKSTSTHSNFNNLVVIPNARTFTVDTPATLDSKTVIAVGRYNFQKQFEVLIDAWKLLAKEFSGWTLRIAGDGEERAFLERRIADYGLQGSVILGPETDMKSAYKNSSILAMTSRYEGLPMVLLEAQACGLPIVSFACKCGPKDVITDGVDGFLVEEGNTTDFADKLFTLMADKELRKSMGAAAYKASDRYDEEKIMARWVALFKELITK